MRCDKVQSLKGLQGPKGKTCRYKELSRSFPYLQLVSRPYPEQTSPVTLPCTHSGASSAVCRTEHNIFSPQFCAHLHDARVIGERRYPQPLNHDVGQMVGVQHQVIPTVFQQVLVVFPLVFLDMLHYRKRGEKVRRFVKKQENITAKGSEIAKCGLTKVKTKQRSGAGHSAPILYAHNEHSEPLRITLETVQIYFTGYNKVVHWETTHTGSGNSH